MKNFEKALFTELRILTRSTDKSLNPLEITKGAYTESLKKALKDEDNLKALGFEINKSNLSQLVLDYIADGDMVPLYERVQKFNPAIEVSPLYPNFPNQVLNASELEFRINQILHYITREKELFVNKAGVEERSTDEQLIPLKTLEYMSEHEVNKVIIGLISRKSRLNGDLLEIAKHFIQYDNRETVTNIPFKENIGSLYTPLLLEVKDNDKLEGIFDELSNILQHPGDVFDLLEKVIVANKYKHLRTYVKRKFVELIEAYPAYSIEENLTVTRWSKNFRGKGGKLRSLQRNQVLLDYLSFNRFSKNTAAKAAVAKLRDNELLSWNQKLSTVMNTEDIEGTLGMLRERPGVYFRKLNHVANLFNLKFDSEYANVISDDMSNLGGKLKTESILSAINNFSGNALVHHLFMKALIANLNGKEIDELKGKNVFIDNGQFNLEHSIISVKDPIDGGYLREGLAIQIPENVKVLRFFTYWNETRKEVIEKNYLQTDGEGPVYLDIDLHGVYSTVEGNVRQVGWNSSYTDKGISTSGDITVADAAEYIDVDLATARKQNVKKVSFDINIYTGAKSFEAIETVFAGLMAVGENAHKEQSQSALYDSKNVFFRNDLKSKDSKLSYATLDLEKNVLILGSKESVLGDGYSYELEKPTADTGLDIESYIQFLVESQGAKIVSSKEDADVILGIEKSSEADEENYISLIDKNFFISGE